MVAEPVVSEAREKVTDPPSGGTTQLVPFHTRTVAVITWLSPASFVSEPGARSIFAWRYT